MQTLKRFTKALLNTLMLRKLPGPFRRVKGHCWTVELSIRTQGSRAGHGPALLVYEDAVPLRYPSCSEEDICTHGRSRFNHSNDKVYFSTSDNSDPNTNGRVYQYSLSPWLFRRRLGFDSAQGSLPCNHQQRDANPKQIAADVAYALGVGRSYLEHIRTHFPSVAGKSVLEVGPGINFGAVMVLACYGLKPLVADRFLAPWEGQYHVPFYTELADALASDSHTDVSPLRSLVKEGGYAERVIQCLSAPMENLPLSDDSVDVVFSNAVVEHLFDLEHSFTQLYRVTSRGGFGFHQVDFRDHRNFDRPLEYLLLEEGDFQSLANASHMECGNRYRPDEATEKIRAAGFEVLSFNANSWSSSEYLKEFLPRLREAKHSRYRDFSEEDLRANGGFYVLRKPG